MSHWSEKDSMDPFERRLQSLEYSIWALRKAYKEGNDQNIAYWLNSLIDWGILIEKLFYEDKVRH